MLGHRSRNSIHAAMLQSFYKKLEYYKGHVPVKFSRIAVASTHPKLKRFPLSGSKSNCPPDPKY